MMVISHKKNIIMSPRDSVLVCVCACICLCVCACVVMLLSTLINHHNQSDVNLSISNLHKIGFLFLLANTTECVRFLN